MGRVMWPYEYSRAWKTIPGRAAYSNLIWDYLYGWRLVDPCRLLQRDVLDARLSPEVQAWHEEVRGWCSWVPYRELHFPRGFVYHPLVSWLDVSWVVPLVVLNGFGAADGLGLVVPRRVVDVLRYVLSLDLPLRERIERFRVGVEGRWSDEERTAFVMWQLGGGVW